MKILSYILSVSVFMTSMPTISYGQPLAPGAGEDPFFECRPRPTGDTERQEQKVKFLEDARTLRDNEVTAKENELKQLKAELEVASQRVQNIDSNNRDTSVMDEKQRLIEAVRLKEQELVATRRVQTTLSENLKMAQTTLLAQKERDKLTNSSIEIFTLTSGELNKRSIGGTIAETNLQLMALATSGVNHLECRASSDTEAASYHIFKAAASVYLTNNLSEVMDYENLAECITKKVLSPTEKKDVQYALIKRAKNLFDEMARHVSSVTETRGTDLELFTKALEYSMKEWAGKNERVETKYGAYLAAKQNYQDAYNWQLGVMIAAIVMSSMIWMLGFGWAVALPTSIALWAWWGSYLKPKEVRLKRELKQSELELRNAHQHTGLSCNYGDAKRWNLANELTQFETYLAAKKRAKDAANAEEAARILEYKRQQQENEQEERDRSEAKTSLLILSPKNLISKKSWTDFFVNSLFAQDKALLKGTITKIEDAYTKSTSTEPISGSIASLGDSRSRIPQFTPGTPQGARVVEELRRQHELKKQAYDAKNLEVSQMYERMDALMADYKDYSDKFGAVATKNPEIKCSNEWPIPYYRAESARNGVNWDSTDSGRAWAELWRTKGCTTTNKATLTLKQTTMENYYNSITPHEQILNALELNMDMAEMDYLTAQQINEGADSSDPYADRLNPLSVQAAAYADFLGKIKAEWKTSSMNTEKDNYILVDRVSNWTLEKLLNEHPTIKNIEPHKKAGFGDAYTRYVYMQYAVDLVLKNLDLLNRAKSMALGQALAYQELLNQADTKLDLDSIALPTVAATVKPRPCMKTSGGRSSADPTCSCKAKGTCATFSFPKAVLSGSSKELSSGIIENYANDTFSGSEGARVSGSAVKRNAAATQKSMDEVKSTLMDQRKSMGFQNTNIENMSNLLSSSISGEARRSAAAAVSPKTSVGRGARILALEKKTEPEKVAQAFAAAVAPRRSQVVTPQKKGTMEMGILSIDEDGSPTDGLLEDEAYDLGLEMGGKVETKGEGPKVADEKPAGVEYDPSKTLWKIITKRYQKSAFPKLLKKKKTEN